ncbi:MAG: DUF948 domain-containing protein [Acidobacteria bacterium]|nr:DUF948 domain-containing protein [Acidobacteriota bacterium]
MQQEHFLLELTIAVLALGALTGILVVLARINGALKELKATVEATRQQIEPVIEEAQQMTQETRASLSTVLKQAQAAVAMVTATTEEITQMAGEAGIISHHAPVTPVPCRQTRLGRHSPSPSRESSTSPGVPLTLRPHHLRPVPRRYRQ